MDSIQEHRSWLESLVRTSAEVHAERIAELTEGESLQTNIALLRNNAAVAAQIAAALS